MVIRDGVRSFNRLASMLMSSEEANSLPELDHVSQDNRAEYG
jgi:hypothetical protein